MDAHLFHSLEPALENLVGSRIVKIYQYDNDIFVFQLYNLGKKQYLIARTGKNMPFLFLTDEHTPRGENPPAHVMRLRKYLRGRRIINMYCAWWERIIFFQVKQEDESNPLWFKIDLKKGVELCFKNLEKNTYIPENEYPKPLFPIIKDIEELQALLEIKERKFSPFLTPSLRKTFKAILEECTDKDEVLLDIKSLLIDLEDGNGDIFIYTSQNTEEKEKKEVYAWQLPHTLQINKEEEIFENQVFALNEYGKVNLLNDVSNEIKKEKSKPFQAEINKLIKLQEKLNLDYDRLIAMCAQKETALAIQAELYSLDKEDKVSELMINNKIYSLNNSLTILENMENLFHQSLRGKRGLIFLEERRQKIDEELKIAREKLREILLLAHTPVNISITDKNVTKEKQIKSSNAQKNKLSPKKEAQKNLPKQVLMRQSKDGFAILLGKDTKGNALALKLASAHDYWLHTADGASAHAIIKRDHNAVHVPESTFEEAGRMVAEKSPFKYDEKALIQYAYAKNIQMMKKSTTLVRIVKSEGSFWVNLSNDNEN